MTVPVTNPETGETREVEVSDLGKINAINEGPATDDQIRRGIDNMEVPSEAKSILYSLRSFTVEIGGVLVKIGKRVLEVLLYVLEKYPATVIGTLVGAVLGYMVSTIPIIGWLLSPIVTPLLTLMGGSIGYFLDTMADEQRRTTHEAVSEAFDGLQGVQV